MGQSPSSVRSKSGRQRSFRSFVRRNKLNKSSLSHTFSLPPSEEYPELMNVNTATEEQLMTLPGVNRQLAQEIVRHRQMIGRFKRVDDLALVSGIGAEKLEVLRPEICTNTRKQVSRNSSCTHSLESIRLPMESRLCSINSSSVFQLQCVPGLNQEIAANIVDYRNKKGPFKSLDDLIKVRGIDIVRLSTVKQHLTLELRKSESVQHLTNGHVNGWTDTTISNGISPRTPHRKSLSMPSKLPMTLPNGFASAPVSDILDLLSAYSHRPIVEEVFKYERDGIKCSRLASWNLHQLSVDKITNPGVREVICRTILEYKLTLIAIQDVLNEAALKMICDELNSPVLRRVREWRNNSHRWEYCLSERVERNLSDDLENGDDDDSPLPEAVLTTNLGLDIVVVVTKTDYMSTLEKEHDYRDEHFDFMQQWIRRFCLQYGAALFYTSAKEDKNCDLLYKYLTHRIYGLPFRTPALIVEKDAVLIPAGWDSMKKISILYENMQSCKPDDYYRDIIVQPATRKSGGSREAEVQAEDEQAFLQRQLAALQAGTPAPRADSPLRATQRATQQLDGTKIGIGPGTPGNEGVLANFFNSLLYKKTGSPGGGRTDASPAAAAARSDAAAELDRLTRAKRPPPPIDLNSSEC